MEKSKENLIGYSLMFVFVPLFIWFFLPGVVGLIETPIAKYLWRSPLSPSVAIFVLGILLLLASLILLKDRFDMRRENQQESIFHKSKIHLIYFSFLAVVVMLTYFVLSVGLIYLGMNPKPATYTGGAFALIIFVLLLIRKKE